MKHTKIIVGHEYVTNSGRIVRILEKREKLKDSNEGIILIVSEISKSSFAQPLLLTSSDIRWTREDWDRKQRHLRQMLEARARNHAFRVERIKGKVKALITYIDRPAHSCFGADISADGVRITLTERELSMLLTKLREVPSCNADMIKPEAA